MENDMKGMNQCIVTACKNYPNPFTILKLHRMHIYSLNRNFVYHVYGNEILHRVIYLKSCTLVICQIFLMKI